MSLPQFPRLQNDSAQPQVLPGRSATSIGGKCSAQCLAPGKSLTGVFTVKAPFKPARPTRSPPLATLSTPAHSRLAHWLPTASGGVLCLPCRALWPAAHRQADNAHRSGPPCGRGRPGSGGWPQASLLCLSEARIITLFIPSERRPRLATRSPCLPSPPRSGLHTAEDL